MYIPTPGSPLSLSLPLSWQEDLRLHTGTYRLPPSGIWPETLSLGIIKPSSLSSGVCSKTSTAQMNLLGPTSLKIAAPWLSLFLFFSWLIPTLQWIKCLSAYFLCHRGGKQNKAVTVLLCVTSATKSQLNNLSINISWMNNYNFLSFVGAESILYFILIIGNSVIALGEIRQETKEKSCGQNSKSKHSFNKETFLEWKKAMGRKRWMKKKSV